MSINWKYYEIWLRCNFIYVVILIFAILDVLLFLPIKFEVEGKIVYHALIDLGIADKTVFATLIAGLATVCAMVYTNNQNLKALKFSLMPNAFQLKTRMDYALFFHRHFEKKDDSDELDTFAQIFALFLKNNSNFRLIAPNTHEYIIVKVLMYKAEEYDKLVSGPKKDAIKIIISMGKLIFMDGKTKSVPIKDIEFFDKYWNNDDFDEDYELNVRKIDVGIFIEKINDEDVCKEALVLYDEVLMILKKGIQLLDSELKLLNNQNIVK